jgi:hypothetical protein
MWRACIDPRLPSRIKGTWEDRDDADG